MTCVQASGQTMILFTPSVLCHCGLTIHSSRRRFAARLNSGVRCFDQFQRLTWFYPLNSSLNVTRPCPRFNRQLSATKAHLLCIAFFGAEASRYARHFSVLLDNGSTVRTPLGIMHGIICVHWHLASFQQINAIRHDRHSHRRLGLRLNHGCTISLPSKET